jgi:hypothetical protein
MVSWEGRVDVGSVIRSLGLQQALRSSLENNVGKTGERAAEGIPMRWRIITNEAAT